MTIAQAGCFAEHLGRVDVVDGEIRVGLLAVTEDIPPHPAVLAAAALAEAELMLERGRDPESRKRPTTCCAESRAARSTQRTRERDRPAANLRGRRDRLRVLGRGRTGRSRLEPQRRYDFPTLLREAIEEHLASTLQASSPPRMPR